MDKRILNPKEPAAAAVIWLHGLGANAEDMAGLAQALPLTSPVKHLMLNAPLRPVSIYQGQTLPAWYDIVSLERGSEEEAAGIFETEARIHAEIAALQQEGFASQQIWLSGFSQGGAMALFAGLQAKMELGGIIALSSYLPMAKQCRFQQNKAIPMFIAAGRLDPVVQYRFTQASADLITAEGYTGIKWMGYPIEHTVTLEEIQDLAAFMNPIIKANQLAWGL